ncbi:MAG TPA: hypothetical protein VGF88_07565 [Acidobacteriaceae bacterium]|jgi:hypothetical protein
MEPFRKIAVRIWPIAAAAVISVALFWGIASGAEKITIWVLTNAVRHSGHSPLALLLPEIGFFASFFPTLIAGRKQKKLKRHPSSPSW